MWIIGVNGFISCVQDKMDAGTIVVRARARADLVDCLSLVGDPEDYTILQLDLRDYRWRTFLTREQFAGLVLALAETVTYTNVKDEVKHRRGPKYANTLMRVWSDMLALDDRPGGWHALDRYKAPLRDISRIPENLHEDESFGFTGTKTKPKKGKAPRRKKGGKR